MSIFGTGRPKIIDASSNTILLDYAEVMQDKAEFNNLLHRSEISQSGVAVVRPHNWIYQVKINLSKRNTNGDVPNAINYFTQVYQLLGTNVTLHRHSDFPAFKDSSGTDVPFVVDEVEHAYEPQLFYWELVDIMYLTLRSLEPVDLVETSKQTLYIDSEEIQIGGEGIILR